MGVQTKSSFSRLYQLASALGMSDDERVRSLERPIEREIEGMEFAATFAGAYAQTKRNLDRKKIN